MGFLAIRHSMGGFGWGNFSENTLLQLEYPIGQTDDIPVMGGNEHGPLLVVDDAFEDVHDQPGCFEIKIAGRLICQDEQRVVGQGACNGNPLLLAPGKQVRKASSTIGQADFFKDRQRSLTLVLIQLPTEFEGEQDVLFHLEGGNQVEGLEDDTDGMPPEQGALGFGQFCQLGVPEADAAGCWRIHSADQVQQGAFA